MSIIKEIYTDGILKKDFKSAAVFIDGNSITDKTQFNIFNRNVLNLNQTSDFTILYTLQVLKDEKTDQHLNSVETETPTIHSETFRSKDPLKGIQIKDPKAFRSKDPLKGIQIKDPKAFRSKDPLKGIQIKDPKRNKSSITINGTVPTDPQTFVRINGNLITDLSIIELYLDGKKIKDVNITIVIEIKKDNLLKYTKIAKN